MAFSYLPHVPVFARLEELLLGVTYILYKYAIVIIFTH